jgi:hypothetical protein
MREKLQTCRHCLGLCGYGAKPQFAPPAVFPFTNFTEIRLPALSVRLTGALTTDVPFVGMVQTADVATPLTITVNVSVPEVGLGPKQKNCVNVIGTGTNVSTSDSVVLLAERPR